MSINQSLNEPDPRNMTPMDAWAYAVKLYEQNRWEESDKYCMRALEGLPGHVEARLLRGIFALSRKEYYLALAFFSGLEEYLKEGQYVTYYTNLTKAYVELGRFKEAVQAGEKAVSLDPNNENALINLGTAYRGLKENEKAIKIFNRLKELNPNNAISYLMLGLLYQDGKTEEDYEKAEEYLRKGYSLDKSLPQSYLWLASILQIRGKLEEMRKVLQECLEKFPENSAALAMIVEDGQIKLSKEQLEAAERRANHPETSYQERIILNFGLHRLFHNMKNYKKSFEYLKKGNELRRVERPYRPKVQEIFAERIIRFFTWERMKKAKSGPEDPDPIFIVSMPRSGSTLLEQILSSHSKVTGAGELPLLAEILRELGIVQPLTSPDIDENKLVEIVDDFLQNKLPEVGERYLKRIRDEYPYETPFVVDKMPGNVQWAGIIAKALPNAKILHIRRDWRDTCWSCYRQNFAEGQNFSYNLDSVKHFYYQYSRIIQHWQSIFPEKILEIRYEDLVNDFENQVKRILSYCNLEYEESVRNFYRLERSVCTASVRQVREPINRKGIGTWKPYEEFLKEWLDDKSPWDRAKENRNVC